MEEVKDLHFFRIIKCHFSKDQGLLIPNNFITKLGHKLSSPVILKVPSGEVWQVEIKEDKAQFWFQNGWFEFMDHHSISVLHFLVFRFDGNSRFSVFIFDTTTCEIGYPRTNNQISVKQENQDHEGSMRILDSHPCRKLVISKFYSRKRAKITSGADYVSCKKRKTTSNQPRSSRYTAGNKKKNTPVSEIKSAVRAAKKFTSIHPYCTVTMKPSHVQGGFDMHLPICFARTHLKEDIKSVTLRVSDERTWQVVYLNQMDRVRLKTGWKAFALDNYLEENEICIFELVDKRHWELKVTIFRVQNSKWNKRIPALLKNSSFPLKNNGMHIDDTKKKREISVQNEEVPMIFNKNDKVNFPSTGESLSSELFLKPRRCTSFFEKQRAITAARLFTSVYPFCTVTMKPSHVHGLFVVNLPIAFARSYLKEDIQSVTLRVSDGKKWQVQYHSKKGQVKLKTGWKVFVLDNYLEEDDICIFELVDKRQWELKVTIFRIQDPKLSKSVLTRCKNLSCYPGHLLGNKRPQIEISGENRKFSGSKEEMENEESPFIVDRDDVVFPNTSEQHITSKFFSESRKFASFSKEEREILEARTSSIYPYCSVILKPSHVRGLFILDLPVLFTRAYLNKDIKSVTLRVSDGRIWPVWCFTNNHKFKLYKGWKEFVLDNYLEEDDVCFFELVDRKYRELKVTIFRVQDPELRKQISAESKMSSCLLGDIRMQNEDSGKKIKISDSKQHIENKAVSLMVDANNKVDLANTGKPFIFTDPMNSSNRMEEESSTSIQMSVLQGFAANQEEDREKGESGSDKPFCIVTMRSSNVQGDFILNLPKAFATKYLKNAFHGVTYCVSNETWHADFVSGDYCKLYRGWKEFVVDNNVREGDACLFELVDRNHTVLNVSIKHVLQHSKQEEFEVVSYNFQGVTKGVQFNASSVAMDSTAEDYTKQETSKQELSIIRPKQEAQHVSVASKHKSSEEEKGLITASSTLTSQNPFCVVTMRRSYVNLTTLTLPSSFSKRYLKGKENATLCSSNGRRYPVRIVFGKSNAKLLRGWRGFVLDNLLEEDDICIFELVDRYQTDLKVTIFRLGDPK